MNDPHVQMTVMALSVIGFVVIVGLFILIANSLSKFISRRGK